MGISKGTVGLLAMTLRADKQRERMVSFGVQKVDASDIDVDATLAACGCTAVARQDLSAARGQQRLFRALGYRHIDSIDYYPDEGPTLVLDLNRPLPTELQAAFDLVYDGGTMEHCFDPAQVLRNAASLVAPGGRVIHHVPLNNWVDHGFYQFSPTLFFDFYGAAGFTDLGLKIHFMKGSRESFVDYDPARDPPVPYALGGRRRVLAFFSARRAAAALPPSPDSLIQGRYRATFGGDPGTWRGRRKGFLQRLRASLRKRLFEWNATRL